VRKVKKQVLLLKGKERNADFPEKTLPEHLIGGGKKREKACTVSPRKKKEERGPTSYPGQDKREREGFDA